MYQPLALGLGTPEIIMILVIILLLFGGAKIPQLMRGVGRGVGELQKGLEEGKKTFDKSMQAEPETTTGDMHTDKPADTKA